MWLKQRTLSQQECTNTLKERETGDCVKSLLNQYKFMHISYSYLCTHMHMQTYIQTHSLALALSLSCYSHTYMYAHTHTHTHPTTHKHACMHTHSGFSLAFEDFWRMLDHLFPTCMYMYTHREHTARTHKHIHTSQWLERQIRYEAVIDKHTSFYIQPLP